MKRRVVEMIKDMLMIAIIFCVMFLVLNLIAVGNDFAIACIAIILALACVYVFVVIKQDEAAKKRRKKLHESLRD